MSSYIILSAGVGRNMRTKGVKSLLKYDGISVLDHQIKTITSCDKSADIYVVVGFEGDKVIKHTLSKKYDIRILYNYNYQLTSQSESWRLAINSMRTTDYYLIHGDIIFNKSILKPQTKSMVVFDKSITDKKSVGVLYRDGKLLNMAYGFVDKWAQIAYISKQDYIVSKSVLNSFKTNKMTFEVLNIINSKTEISAVSSTSKTIEINRNYENSDTK